MSGRIISHSVRFDIWWPLVTSILTCAKKWRKHFESTHSERSSAFFRAFLSLLVFELEGVVILTYPPPPPGRRWLRAPPGRELTLPHGAPGNNLFNPHPTGKVFEHPLCFFEDSEKNGGASRRRFLIPCQPSFCTFFWKFCSPIISGLVTRSGQVTLPTKQSLWC